MAGGGLEADIDRNLRRIEAQLAAGRRSQERREEIRRKNATSRATARSEAAAAEQAARGTAKGARRRELTAGLTARRPDVMRAVALLARKYGVTVTVGWSTGDPRYAGGIPLVGADGAPAAVFDPVPRLVRGEAFLLLTGILLLFPGERCQEAFEKAMRRTRYKPVGGMAGGFH